MRMYSWLFLVCLASCASASRVARRAPVLRFSQLAGNPSAASALTSQKPFVLQFEPGEHIPVHFDLDSSIVRTEARPLPLTLLVTQRFWVLVDPTSHAHPVRTSLDGHDFDARQKNGFRFGFAATPEAAYVDLGLAVRPAGAH